MTDRGLWRQMENLANEEPLVNREIRFLKICCKAE